MTFNRYQAVGSAILLSFGLSAASGEIRHPRADIPPRNQSTWISAPTGMETRSVVENLEANAPPDYASLMRPRFRFGAEYESEVDGISVGNFDARVTIPTYPFYGPPPPFISASYSYTGLNAPDALALPPSLHDFTIGASWMRPLTERWMLRFMASAAFATDLENTSGDAWQFRGGLFATYKRSENLQWLIGAFASGRADIPVLPGIGAIWTPTPYLHLNLMMPRPRVSYMIADFGDRQHWLFLAGGLNGGTWAFRSGGIEDRITYRQWRVGLGWESTPPRAFPPIPAAGLKFETQVDYVFGREFEFDSSKPSIYIDDTWLIRASLAF